MNDSIAKCPDWLANHIHKSGGSVSFFQFMDWALNDPINGSYASGKLRIGKDGDFVTSPSLGPEFCELLAKQIAAWVYQLEIKNSKENLISIVDIGPGEGDLTFHLIKSILKLYPELVNRIEFILVEINKGMRDRQRCRLSSLTDISIKWTSLNKLIDKPVTGIIIAHEILDSLPVDRIVLKESKLYTQGVKLFKYNNQNYLKFVDLPLSSILEKSINEIQNNYNLCIPPIDAIDGWTSEWHSSLNDWFGQVSKALRQGPLLIIDYALEAHRYYQSKRDKGTIISYQEQKGNSFILEQAGCSDITAHICLETLFFVASQNLFTMIGERRQGLALLALGLANNLSNLSNSDSLNLEKSLQSRENLLRLVDPSGLGEFRWILFFKGKENFLLGEQFESIFLNNP